MKGFVRSIHLDLISFLSGKLESAFSLVQRSNRSHHNFEIGTASPLFTFHLGTNTEKNAGFQCQSSR